MENTDCKVERDKDFELTDEEKLRFRHYLELHGCSLESMNREIKDVAEQLHHLAFKYLMLENELKTKAERLASFERAEELIKNPSKG